MRAGEGGSEGRESSEPECMLLVWHLDRS
jgi:hypothetical protein